MPASQRAGDRGPAKVNAAASLAVGFKSLHCAAEFGSRTAIDIHRRHRSDVRTLCDNPKKCASLSFTAHAVMSTGILRHHHAGSLGESLHTFGHCVLDK